MTLMGIDWVCSAETSHLNAAFTRWSDGQTEDSSSFLFFCVRFFSVGVVEGAEPEVWHQHQTGVWGVVGGGFGCFLLCASLLDDCSLISRPETHQIVFNCPVKPVKSVKAVHSRLFARQPCECLIFFFKQTNETGSSFWLWTRSLRLNY